MIAEALVSTIGIALLFCAYAANQHWIDRHFLPRYFTARETFMATATILRVLAVAAGLLLIVFVRPRLGRLVARGLGGAFLANTLRISIAVLLALGASELILRAIYGRTDEMPGKSEPLRQPDPRLGWTFIPARAGHAPLGGRMIDYAIDPSGYRVRTLATPVDPARPSILFTGESMVVGYGLHWEESLPAQVQSLMGVQSADLAVNGYTTYQSYLRLKAELPRFRRPLAVVMIFMPVLLDRNIDDRRPHPGPGLVWHPAVHRWRLATLAQAVVRYRSDEAIRRGIETTREALRAGTRLAHARGAAAIILVPRYTSETAVEQRIREQILDSAGLPYVLVNLDPSWRVPGDWHPDARAAHAMATAVVQRLNSDWKLSSKDQSLPATSRP